VDTNQYLEVFIGEMTEHLQNINESLLKLEQDKQDKDIINEIFRAAHTIKGMAASMGFEKMANLTHGMEDVLQDIRDGRIEIDTKLINLLFVCHDFLENSLDYITRNGSEGPAKIDNIMGKLHSIIQEKNDASIAAKGNDKDIKLLYDNSEEVTITVNKSEQDTINEAIKSGMNVYNMAVELDNECAFKSVRAYMIFESLEEVAEIIKSHPVVSEIKSGSVEFDSNIIKAIIATEENSQELEQRLYSISEVRKVCISTIDNIETDGEYSCRLKLIASHNNNLLDYEAQDSNDKIINEIIEGPNVKYIDIGREFFTDCISEIIEQLRLLKIKVSELEIYENSSDIIYQLFRGFHTIKGLSDFIEFRLAGKIAGETEKILNKLRNQSEHISEEIQEIIKGSINYIQKLCEDTTLQNNSEFMGFINMHLIHLKNLSDYNIIYKTGPMEEAVKENNTISDSEKRVIENIKNPGNEQKNLKEKESLKLEIPPIDTARETQKAGISDGGFIRIPASRVNKLSELSGELLIIQSQIEQEMESNCYSRDSFSNIIVRMSRITKQIQNLVMQMQMVSLKPTFQKLSRIARDTIKDLGKDTDFRIIGEETEIDREVADKLLDPLMHLVKNAISHGIESKEVRENLGKPLKGLVELHAYSKRDSVYIEVRDDGSGIPIDKVYNKALEKGIIDASKNYTDQEIINFIFLPGFSTAETINSISGRGVGMDAVRTQIHRIGGKVEVESTRGKGSIFKLKIPISSSAMNGTIINIMEDQYIIPTLSIKQIVQVKDEQWVSIKGVRSMIRIRDKIIPVINVAKIFGEHGDMNSQKTDLVIIIESEQGLKALPIQNILGRREVVVRPLGSEFNDLKFITGATILGDGRVILILDIDSIISME